MFRDLYKQANDEIKGDREILDRAFLQAAQPKKSNGKMKIFYSFATTAVAAVVIIGALFVNSDIFSERVVEMVPEEKDTVSENENIVLSQEENKEKSALTVAWEDVMTQSETKVGDSATKKRTAEKKETDKAALAVSETAHDGVATDENEPAVFSLRGMGRSVECDDSYSEDVLGYELATEETEEKGKTESFSYMYDKSNYIGVSEGFKNVEISPVTTEEEAIERAMEELDGEYILSKIYKDDIEKVWKVSFDNVDTNKSITVYVDFDGITVFIVNN